MSAANAGRGSRFGDISHSALRTDLLPQLTEHYHLCLIFVRVGIGFFA